jgi:hypothetical protein
MWGFPLVYKKELKKILTLYRYITALDECAAVDNVLCLLELAPLLGQGSHFRVSD